MKKYTYNFEIKDLLTQFVAAFDDTVIKRFNRSDEAEQEVAVRYVMAPKQRIMHDIINKAQNIKLPVVAVDLAGVSYDTDRVFNKLGNFDNYANVDSASTIGTPTPVNLSVNMSIMCRYMQDMEQILSNFVPYTNPYIVLAWKEPVSDARGNDTGDVIEIRSEVMWSQDIGLNTPKDTTYSEKFRIIADTSFTIKGWLFRNKNETANPIWFIDTNFINTAPDYSYNAALSSLDYETFFTSLSDNEGDVETISLSGIPELTNIYFTQSGSAIETTDPVTITANSAQYPNRTYTVIGNNYNETEFVMLSSNDTITTGFTALSTPYTGDVEGYLLPDTSWTVMSNEVMQINLPSSFLNPGRFDLIIKNPAGWKTSAEIDGFYFTAQ